ncbi:MAG: hypothetical protein H6741_26520 [Alphaproteobacteria bacterium]|nr:hypothetical protein [Alphaproteobacteria bacterium]MCB9796264.1 hypothetical protein [Alphaproteobacteria bacterium]
MLRTNLILGVALLALAGCGEKDSVESAAPINNAPVADAGADQSNAADLQVCLNGSASFDPDGDALTYHWGFEHLPEASALPDQASPFSDNHSETATTPCFYPDAVGTYVISLWVTDGDLDSPKDYVVVSAESPENIPVADAGIDQLVSVDDSVQLDGSGSYDLQGRGLSYVWSVVEVPELSSLTDAGISDLNVVNPTFTADAPGVYVLNLQVNNGLADSLADAMVVTAVGEDGVPVANAGLDTLAEDCTHVQLDGSGSTEPDGESLTYRWQIQSKPAGSAANSSNFSDAAAESPTFFGDVHGTYVLSLAVSDGQNWSPNDLVTVELTDRSYNSPPEVTITDWATISGGDVECTLNGYTYDCDDCPDQDLSDWGSNVTVNDPDSDPYTVLWEMTNGDGTIYSPTSLVTRVRLEDVEASETGVCDTNEYEMTLTVTDCTGEVVVTETIIPVECCGVEATDTGN